MKYFLFNSVVDFVFFIFSFFQQLLLTFNRFIYIYILNFIYMIIIQYN